jgi:hypothetical protein
MEMLEKNGDVRCEELASNASQDRLLYPLKPTLPAGNKGSPGSPLEIDSVTPRPRVIQTAGKSQEEIEIDGHDCCKNGSHKPPSVDWIG